MASESGSSPGASAHGASGGIQGRVALALLLALRDHDRPGEVLKEEDLTVTLPRRFGLSDVVDSQIRRYEQEVRRRVPESDVRDLIRLVTRRPDSEEVFQQVGRSLLSNGGGTLGRMLPRGAAYSLARRQVVRRIRSLFGRPFVLSAGAPFRLEASQGVLMDGDPGGHACALVTGLSQAVLERSVTDGGVVRHEVCRARGHDRCIWEAQHAPAVPPGPVGVSSEDGHG